MRVQDQYMRAHFTKTRFPYKNRVCCIDGKKYL